MMTNRTIKYTNRITLKIFTKKYITNEYISWLNDAEVVKYSELRHVKQDYKTILAYIDSIKDESRMFAIILDNDKHIGNITLRMDRFNLNADVSIMIGNKVFWGCGLAKEAIIASIYWLRKNTNMMYIIAGTMQNNEAMKRTFESLDFEYSGHRKQYFKKDNNRVDMLFYSKLLT
jgi:[ribosomal protein S5]-alanine N-acetyltransferase